jgi:hypothetical protein
LYKQGKEADVEVENMEGVCDRRHEAVEVVAGRCAGSRCLEEWHFGKPSNPCKRGNTEVKPMMMMIWVFVVSLCFVAEGVTVECLIVMNEETVKSVVHRAGLGAFILSKIKAVSI